jgi:hypothetical protein
LSVVETQGTKHAHEIGCNGIVVSNHDSSIRRFAPGRLYDVPVKLGWLDKPTLENDLNPVHPHT